jgi:hypothetical protein
MGIDLNTDWIRKDSASASNIYYGYSYNTSATDGEKVFAIRKVNTTSGVESVTWTNGSQISYCSSWSDRVSCFTTPSGSLGLTWSATQSSLYRSASVSWNFLSGCDIYLVEVRTEGGALLNVDGLKLQGQYVTRTYTTDLINKNYINVGFLEAGTYSVRVTAKNVAGTSASTATFNFT